MGLYGGSGGDSSGSLKDPQSSVVSIILSLEQPQHLRTNCPTRVLTSVIFGFFILRWAENWLSVQWNLPALNKFPLHFPHFADFRVSKFKNTLDTFVVVSICRTCNIPDKNSG